MTDFVPLEEIAQVSLGYKSLQNDFYYVNRATIETYGIEKDYLRSIIRFKQLDGAAYWQDPKKTTWLFSCREKESDLRGTGALKYIHAMANRPAAEKKQSGGMKTIREVLEAQSGGLWYAPKAKPHPTRIWLRKAFNTIYAPFIFKTPAVVDQRCNYIEPTDADVSWDVLAAMLTSTVFAFAVEVNGSASMGAGALEAPTSKIRGYPVFDVRELGAKEKKALVKLASAVWSDEAPVNWAAEGAKPGPKLQALDAWLLAEAGSEVSVKQLHEDLRDACASRIRVAEDKVKTKKKHASDSVGNVAKGIADQISKQLNGRQFPESFYATSSKDLLVHVPRSVARRITLHPLLDEADIVINTDGGKSLFKGSFNSAVAEAIVRSILLGRENFHVPADRKEAAAAVAAFLVWFDKIQTSMDQAIEESALGTGYEETLRKQVYQLLGIHPLAGERVLPPDINISPVTT